MSRSSDERPSWPVVTTLLVVAAVVGFFAGALLARVSAPRPVVAATPSSQATPEPSEPAAPGRVTLAADRSRAAPGELIQLSGRVRPPDVEAVLQVERSLGDEQLYVDFPVTAETDQDGRYVTFVRTEQPGRSRFRVATELDGARVVSDPVTVVIG